MGEYRRNYFSRRMSIGSSIFETLVPSRYVTFTIPSHHRHHLQIAVLDSPSATTAAATAAIFVPPGRESDWIFSTFSGHLQLLFSSPASQPLSRLILVGNLPSRQQPTSYNSTIHSSSSSSGLQQNLAPLLLALAPKVAFLADGVIPEIPFLIYEDGVVKSSILEICEGPCVGEMCIENVELDNDGVKEFRRRLRFKRMPNFVQTQMRICPKKELSLENLDDVEFELDKTVLVQSYLSPMVAGISVISQFLDRQMQGGIRPKALCLGVGGGALLGFLRVQLNFEVVGVEEDGVVLEIAKRHFGLENDELIHLFTEDGILYVKNLAKNIGEDSRFHVMMVDLDSNDATVGVCTPPLEFVRKSILLAVRAVLCEEGVLVVNTIPSSKLNYDSLIGQIREVFEELYEIDVGNEENFVLIATKSQTENALEADGCSILNKLKLVVSRSYIDSIRKIPGAADPAL